MTGAQKCSMLNAVSPLLLSVSILAGTVQFGLASITLIATDHSASWLIILGFLKLGMAVLIFCAMVIYLSLLQLFARLALRPPMVSLLLARLVQMFYLCPLGPPLGHCLLYQNNTCLHSLQVRWFFNLILGIVALVSLFALA